ncbi:hypothetical protein M407DRAFT_241096 [Tulasnella calospora MUT 4182]|uniref:Uncharacterized protein n=1 Tax=Tulasnella calospora MUT 4182 TaxID=1051891 RepID=A0A0C3QWK9_9AGAM|nr:hypothetical protein M407DRAFT_241096 [Tulasnella calospora MUT 4182]
MYFETIPSQTNNTGILRSRVFEPITSPNLDSLLNGRRKAAGPRNFYETHPSPL